MWQKSKGIILCCYQKLHPFMIFSSFFQAEAGSQREGKFSHEFAIGELHWRFSSPTECLRRLNVSLSYHSVECERFGWKNLEVCKNECYQIVIIVIIIMLGLITENLLQNRLIIKKKKLNFSLISFLLFVFKNSSLPPFLRYFL